MKKSHLFWLRLFNVRKDESGTVSYFFLHHFSLGLGLALLLTVSGTLFLSTFTPDYFPLVYILSAFAMMLAGRAYSYFEHSVPFKKLLPRVLLSLVLLTVFFRIAVHIPGFYWLPVMLFIGFRVIYLLGNLEFWGLSSLVFDVRQGKRLFGLISSGDVPAKLLGYLSVYMLVPYIGLHNLLIVAAVAFAGSYYFLYKILRHSDIAVLQPVHHHQHFSDSNFLQTYFGNNFILILSVLGFFTTTAFTIIDFTFFTNVQAEYESQESLATFLSIFFTVGYGLTLVIKLIFSGRLTYNLGIKRSLMLMPLVMAAFSVYYFFRGSHDTALFNNLMFIGILSMATGVVKYSINDPVYLALFQPMPTQFRLKGHTLIKGFIQPVAIGFTGLIIWAVSSFRGEVSFYNLNIGLVIVIVLWLIAILYTHKGYVTTLEEAIRKRFIAGSDIAIRDASYFDLLRKKLESSHSEEVIYAIVTLEKNKPEILHEAMGSLLQRDNDWILENAMPVAGREGWDEFEQQLFRIFNTHPSERIRALAVETLCMFRSSNSRLGESLTSAEGQIRKALIAGLVLHGDTNSRLDAERKLEELIHSADPEDQIAACRIIYTIGDQSYYKDLLRFIQSDNVEVQLEAVRAAVRIPHVHLLDPLFTLMAHPELRREAVNTLGSFGALIIDEIRTRLGKGEDHDEEQLIRFIRILEKCGDQNAARVMFSIAKLPVIEVRSRALTALYYMEFSPDKQETADLQDQLSEEFRMIYRMLSGMEEQWLPDELRAALLYETEHCRKRIFILLGLLYDAELVRKAEAALQVAGKEKKANALEVLDHIIPRKIHDSLSTLVEEIPVHEKLERLRGYEVNEKHMMPALIIIHGRAWFSDWTIAMALRAAEITDPAFIFTVQFLSCRNAVLRQCAFEALKSFREDHHAHFNSLIANFKLNPELMMEKHSENRLSEIEKVLVLKSTALFSDTPENIIAELVGIVKEEFVSKDEMIFRKGDSGSSMYIIYEGEVKIHDGNRIFAVMGSRDFFGELALLDPEPRSASATATTDTLLLKLEEDDAYELMEERTEVLKSIMRILCRRIRAQNLKLLAVKSVN